MVITTTSRIAGLIKGIQVDSYPVCIEKARLMTEIFRKTEGMPEILRRANALSHMLDNITIFIRNGELIVGNGASKYMGVEMEFNYGPWSEEEILALNDAGYAMAPEDIVTAKQINEYWKGRNLVARIGHSFDDERLWPFMQTGIVLAPWKTRQEGSGGGYAESGMGLGPGFYNNVEDYEKVIKQGLQSIVDEAVRGKNNLKMLEPGAVAKGYFLDAVIISLNAVIRFANRFAALADNMARVENDPLRRKELETIAEICRQVPAKPARTFREAVQSFWFIFLMMSPSPTAGIGRLDQVLYPLYKKDKTGGKLTDEEAVEVFQCLRLKDMELNRASGVANRQKNAGRAKWHNCVIGGQKADGSDATNELSYLILEAARRCPTPHHTISVRVHDGTPEKLMVKALELVKTGIGMPAFVGDLSYIKYIRSQGVSLAEARDYCLAGCLDPAIAGKSRISAFAMFIVPMVFEITMNNGVFPKTGKQLGPKTGEVSEFQGYDDFLKAFKTQLNYFFVMNAEYNNIWMKAHADIFPDPVRTALLCDAISKGKGILERTYPLENGAVINTVGMVNTADSLTAVKKLVFDEKKYTFADLKTALAANWRGFEQMRKDFLSAPKYGNDSDYADATMIDLFNYLADACAGLPTEVGGIHQPSAVSISSQWPGGAQTGATPDGRLAGTSLADGSLSPAHGKDLKGPTAILNSAAKVDQSRIQATLLNMKFHPSALSKEEDIKKLAHLIQAYFKMGGKHIQFNVVSKDTLLDAQQRPESYKDLVVRVAGYSAYFVDLGKAMQDEIIARTEHSLS